MKRVLVVDDHPVVRAGLRQVIESAGDMAVTAEVGRAYEALALLTTQEFDAVLLDISLPDLNGIELLKVFKRDRPHLPVLMLSVYDEELYAVRAMREGAAGYLTKNSASEELVTALRRVCEGGHYITAALAERLATAVRVGVDRPAHTELSLREFEVFRMIGRGMRLRAIAEQLHLSPKTVSTYRSRIFAKMQLRTNEDAVQYAVRNGLVE